MAHDTKPEKNASSKPGAPGSNDPTPIDEAVEPQEVDEDIDENEFADFVAQELGDGASPAAPAPKSKWKRRSKSSDASSDEVAELKNQLEEAVAARQRAHADFVNFQRRSRGNEMQAGRDGVIAVIRTLMPVIDNVDLALTQDPATMTVEQMADGVKILREELMKALQAHLVQSIRPEPGAEFDPKRHHAVMRMPTAEFPENTIVTVLQVGFALEDQVLRPATVVVAAPPDECSESAPDEADAPSGDETTEGS